MWKKVETDIILCCNLNGFNVRDSVKKHVLYYYLVLLEIRDNDWIYGKCYWNLKIMILFKKNIFGNSIWCIVLGKYYCKSDIAFEFKENIIGNPRLRFNLRKTHLLNSNLMFLAFKFESTV